MIKCNICSKECKSTKSLLSHVKYSHNLTVKEFYDLYHEKGKCKICGNPTTFTNFSLGYKTYCSAKCSAQSETTKQKRITTNLKKYGCENISQNETIKQQKVETYKSHVDEIKEKVKQTNRQRYGCDWVTQSEEFKQKYKESCMKKYGVDNYTKSKEYLDKIQQTKNDKINYMISKGYIPLQEINAKYGTGWYQKNGDKVTTYKNKGYIDSKYLSEIEQYSTRVNSKFQQEVFDFIIINL